MNKIQKAIREIITKQKSTVYQVAKAIGVDHGNLYRSLSNGSNLELNTMLRVLNYLGYEIRFVKSKREEVKPIKSKRKKGGDLNGMCKKET